ncbi:spore germination protein GerW family protein [Streptomyces sp. NPDC057877]|uniref:spore germination protein GerW family protein n=1 Tax=Streptomyces sp. NPDC057877 TaxID=3346269 RepID=UPI0036C6A374
MNNPEETTAPATPADLTAAHASATLLERLADKLGAHASVTAVYGEPVTRDGVTVIPVARVGYGFGGGAGRSVKGAEAGDGGGGGGGVDVRPLGFIEIKDGTATYRPIREPWTDVVLPLAGVLAGSLLPRLVQALRRRRA